jgi:hypothetical protein
MSLFYLNQALSLSVNVYASMPPAFKNIVSLPTREDSRGRRRRNANIFGSIF